LESNFFNFFVVVIGKFRVENGKILGEEWENFGCRNIFGGKCLKMIIGNLAYREILFFKKALLLSIIKFMVISIKKTSSLIPW